MLETRKRHPTGNCQQRENKSPDQPNQNKHITETSKTKIKATNKLPYSFPLIAY